MEVDDEEDSVVQEIPVFITQPENSLFIFQYLNQPSTSECMNTVIKSNFKPKNEEVQLEIALDTSDNSYCRPMGEQLALNCDGFDSNERDKIFNRKLVDKQFLKSEKISIENNNLTVGIVHDNRLTLAPITSVLALKPYLPYLDKTDKRAKQEMKEEGDLSEQEEEEEDTIAKAVTVKFARRENERTKKAREKSFNFINAKNAEEPWFDAQYCDTFSKKSVLERNKLRSNLEDRMIAMTIDNKEYLKYLIPEDDDHETWKKDEAISLRQLKQQPLTDQIKYLLRDVKIISMRKLLNFLNIPSSEEIEVKKYLQQHGMLVQGNWIVKSDVLYPKDSSSSIFGVPSDVMCRTRDYMIYLFSLSTFVQKTAVMERIKIPDRELSIMFEQIARYHPQMGWKLVLPPDDHFISKNPDIVERQKVWFFLKHKQICETLSEIANKATTSSNRKNSTRSRHDSCSDKEGTRQRKNSTRSRHDSASDVETSRQRKNSTRSRHDSASDAEMSNNKRKNSTSEKECKTQRQRKNSSRSQDSASDIELKPTEMGSPSLNRKTKVIQKNNEDNINRYDSSESDREMKSDFKDGGNTKRKCLKIINDRRRSGIEVLVNSNGTSDTHCHSFVNNNSRSPR